MVQRKARSRMLPNPVKYATWLAVLRIYAGVFWLTHGIPKLLNPQFFGPQGFMVTLIRDNTSNGGSGAYAAFLTHVVIPNADLFSHLVAWGETLTGVSLLLGLLTPVGGVVGMFLAFNYFMTKGSYAHITALGGLDFAAIMLSFINVALPTGLVAGFDGVMWASRTRRPAAGKT